MNAEGTLSTRPRRGMARPAAIASVALLCLSTFIPGTGVNAAKAPPTCSLVPQLRDVTINQGVGAYTPLVRGKETLVRAYLAKPTCAAAGAVIELTGGTLSVTPGTAPAVTIAAPTPRPTAPFPQLAAATSAPLVDSTADPVWVVPGSALAPSTTSARFTATFRVTITYQSKTSATATPVAGTITFTTRPGTTTPITATVEKLTNALRVLVVPMGDASKAFASQYTAAGDAALQAAMLTLSRIYPIPEGVGSLTGTSGGLRYSVSPGLLDLRGVLGTDGRFCGTGGSTGNFNAIKASLGQFLQSWNAANGAANQADRVLGVVDAAISNGSALGCAEGMAAINSNEAWIRAVPELQGVPSQSGFVAALELGHTFGLVLGGPSPTPDRDDLFSKYHSPNIYADPQRTNRSYNTRLRSVLVDDRTAMTYIGTANNNNTLLEQLDWAYLICRLGGATSTECPAPAVPVGSGAGVAAGPRFVISGVTTGTAAGTSVLESFFSTNMLPTPQNAASPYRLVYRSASGAILSNFGLPVQTEDSAHSHDDDGPTGSAPLTLFSGAFDFPGTPTRIELWNGSPPSGQLLYVRDRTTAPVLTSLSTTPAGDGPTNYTNDSVNMDFAPALSADGRWIAWPAFDPSAGSLNIVVRVAPTDDVSQQARLSDGDDIDSTDPAWCSSGSRLAYVDPNDGGLWTIPVNTSSVPATFGTPTMIYDASLPGNFRASHPTWSPDCSQLAFEADDDIWRIDSDGTDLVALTNDDSSHDPNWSPDADNNRIAFVVSGFTAFFGGPMVASGDDAIYASFVSPEPDQPTALFAPLQLTVNAADDGDDLACDVTHCSLREAINAANASPNDVTPDEIDFNIDPSGAHTILLDSALPPITDPVIIDGTSQPGWSDAPIIEVDGSGTAAGTDGLLVGLSAPGSTIQGLAINAFPRDGVRIAADDVVVSGNYIGLGLDGTTDRGNGFEGVNVLGVDGTQIGVSSGSGTGNVISGNQHHGVFISGGSPVVGTIIGGNLIGTDAAGTGGVGNTTFGVFLASGSDGTLVGGSSAAERNVISANAFGIVIAAGADANVIQGNYIGTDVTGTADLGNIGQGIEISDATNNVIGSGVPNVISGNGELSVGADGVRIDGDLSTGNNVSGNIIGLDATGDLPLGNSDDGVEISGDATRTWIHANSIDANGGLGIDLDPDGVTPNDADDSDTGANELQNFPVVDSAVADGFATFVTGTLTSLGDAAFRVDVFASDSCDPSGNGEGARMLGSDDIVTAPDGTASFSLSGIPTADAGAGDFITATATDLTGFSTSEFSPCLAVTAAGLTVNSTDDTDDTVCNATHCSLREAMNAANGTAGADTISFDIPGGGQQTIDVATPLPPLTEVVTIDGTTQPGFGGTPLVIVDGPSGSSSGLVLDGAPATSGSTIQGLALVNFGLYGIEIHGSSDHILDNYIGTSNGTTAAPNGNGLLIGPTADTTEVRGNLISGNTNDGIDVQGAGSDLNSNRIGVNFSTDAPLPNGEAGIYIGSTATATTVGGDTDVTPGLENWIGGNIDSGIVIDGSNGNTVQGNFIGVTGELGPLGNGDAGVSIINGGQVNQVGADHSGTTISGPGNVIAFNGGNGVQLISGATDADFNSVHSNAIYENGGLGIDLEADGVTANDPGDDDDGANDLTNFPDLIEAESDGEETFGVITNTTADDALIIAYQLFVSTSCDPSGNGEGERYLTTLNTTSDGTGFAEAPFSIPEDLEGMWLTATTSDTTGSTSEFSECFEVQGAGFGDEIHLLDPTTPLGATEFVVNGFDPAWRSGSLLYATDDELHRIQPDGTGDEVVTSGFADSSPSGAPGVTAFVRTQGGDDDIWLIVDGETVTVTATDQTPENLRLDLYYVCGGQSMPIAVALTPDITGATTASFQANYDPSLSCAGGTIEAALTDGFLRTTTPPGSGEPVASDPKPPVAATYGPPLGSTYLTSDIIPFHGIGEDADDGTLIGASLRWFIRPASAPCCGTPAGTGGSVDFEAGSLVPGDYIVTLLATDPDGQTDTAESLIHVIPDTDHDGFSDAAETNTCFGAGAVTDGSTPSGDADNDGLPNASDPEPCVAATVYNAIVDFNPNDLNLTSSGTPVTISVQTPGRDIRQIVGSSVRIVEASGATTNLTNVGWSVSGSVGTAKFARQPLITFLKANGVTTGTVWIVVSGSSNTNPAWSFTGRDTTNAKP